MSMKTTISASEPIFTHGDAQKIAGISAKSLSQWHQRDQLPGVGTMSRSGRRLYSLIDLWRLKLTDELVGQTGAPPGEACRLALALIQEFGKLAAEEGDQTPADADNRFFVIIVRRADGELSGYLIRSESLVIMAASRHERGFTVIPFTDFLWVVGVKAMAALAAEDGAEIVAPDKTAGADLDPQWFEKFLAAFERGLKMTSEGEQ
ncbi:MAG: MerR family transcriptional regulator [Pseudomonadota bacterium]